MDWFADNWPLILAGLAAVILLTGIVKQIAKMAFVLVCLAVIVIGVVTQLSI